MNARRVEITLDQVTWDRLEAARLREPRASFVKRALIEALAVPEVTPMSREERALESALDGTPYRLLPEDSATYKAAWDSGALDEQFMEPTPVIDAVSPDPSRGVGKASRPMRPLPAGVKSARQFVKTVDKDVAARQRRLNEGKG